MTADRELSSSDALTLLSLCELFSEVDPDSAGDLGAELELLRVDAGEDLIRAGDQADCMYTVVSGRLHVLLPLEDGELQFAAEIPPGGPIGEAGMLDRGLRMATVRAVRDSEVLRVNRSAFNKLAERYPGIVAKIAQTMVARLRSADRKPVPPPLQTIAVVAAGGAGPVTAFAEELCLALGAFGPVLHLSRSRFRQIYGREFEQGDAVVRWMSELERAYRFVVWDAESACSDWTALCVRIADRVIAVGNAESGPELNDTEKAILGGRLNRRVAVELVLLHNSAPRVYAGTAKWLAPRNPRRSHHVRLDRPGDIVRLARVLVGRAIGLTLGGGGARGLAHIGVIRAMEEAGIPIDMIGGVSTGAIVAGLYAMGCDWQSMAQMADAGLVRGGLRSDLTLPLVSLTSGRRFRRTMQNFFGEVSIEDLWLNYFCVSCDLSTSELVVHRTGPLWKCVSASNALPGILPPVLHEGHVLIDGGILNNQPGDVMKEICGGQSIVCNVSPKSAIQVDSSYKEMPSSWKVLFSRNPFSKTIRVPGITATMMGTLLVASNRKSREVERTSDFYLRPPLERFRLDDWSKISEIVDAGYQYTKREIEAWCAAGRLGS